MVASAPTLYRNVLQSFYKKSRAKLSNDFDGNSDDGHKSIMKLYSQCQEKPLQTLKEIRQTFASKEPKDFKKIRILGRGGVGRVYLVRLKNTDKFFAMKVLEQKEMIERNKVKRVLTEQEILATTNHPFIVSLYYSFQSKSRLYFIMDFCSGGEFYQTIQIQPYKCLTESQVRFYAAEVLLALEYLHVMGFIYRDLKPENILLHANGHIRLTDFDLSKASVTPVNAHVVQSIFNNSKHLVAEPSMVTNSFVGTEEYLAPEVILGKGYGVSVDWWTFGILIYEMLYGFTPFRGVNRYETFCNIERTKIKFPDHPRCTVSKECKSLIRKLLCHDFKRRLGSDHGPAEIREHPFFAKINWPLIRNQTPPILPALSNPLDFSCYSGSIVDDDLDDDLEAIDTYDLDESHPFKAFKSLDRESEHLPHGYSDKRLHVTPKLSLSCSTSSSSKSSSASRKLHPKSPLHTSTGSLPRDLDSSNSDSFVPPIAPCTV